MKTMKNFLSMAALALVGAMMTGCSNEDDIVNQQPENKSNLVTVTTTVSLAGGETRAVTDAGVKTFAVGDQVALKYWNTGIGGSGQWDKALSQVLTAEDISADGKTATLTFTLSNPEADGSIQYVYPATMTDSYGQVDYSNLSTQDGTLTSLSANLDLATGSGNLSGTNLPANVALTNELAILAITLKNSTGASEITSGITGMTLSDGTNDYAVTRSAAAGPIYVAIRPTSSANIEITATDGTKNYTKSLTGKTYEASNGYNVSWKMAKTYDGLTTPLTFEAKADGFTVSLSTSLTDEPSLQYSIDDGDWTDYVFPLTTPSVSTGHTISFRAKTTNGAFADEYNNTSFACSEACYIYGNVMSLLSKDDFATATSVPAYAFLRLFFMNTNISNHPTKALALPATTLATSCYEGMFMLCSGLTTAPNLPATTLATSCYLSMFLMCSGLTTAPNLPATTLATSCYNNMFYNCSALTTAPNLPATTLAEHCYDNMFSGCTGLVNAPEISATTLAAHCCATMFNGCTSLVTGPTLSATTLTDYCYNGMFYGCSSLTSVTCLATDISADYCLGGWLNGATATGTLYVDASMTKASWDVPGTWSVAAH